MAVSFKGQQCQWGTDTTASGGIVVNDKLGAALQTDPVESREGALVGLVIYDEAFTGSLDIVLTTGNPPKNGDILTVYGQRLLVVNTEKAGQHKGKRMYSVTLTGGASLSL